MTDGGRRATRRAFWRCRECGAPNPTRNYPTHCLGCGGVGPAQCERKAPPRGRPGAAAPRRLRAWVAMGLDGASYGYAACRPARPVFDPLEGGFLVGVVVLLFTPRWLFLAPALALGVIGLLRTAARPLAGPVRDGPGRPRSLDGTHAPVPVGPGPRGRALRAS